MEAKKNNSIFEIVEEEEKKEETSQKSSLFNFLDKKPEQKKDPSKDESSKDTQDIIKYIEKNQELDNHKFIFKLKNLFKKIPEKETGIEHKLIKSSDKCSIDGSRILPLFEYDKIFVSLGEVISASNIKEKFKTKDINLDLALEIPKKSLKKQIINIKNKKTEHEINKNDINKDSDFQSSIIKKKFLNKNPIIEQEKQDDNNSKISINFGKKFTSKDLILKVLLGINNNVNVNNVIEKICTLEGVYAVTLVKRGKIIVSSFTEEDFAKKFAQTKSIELYNSLLNLMQKLGNEECNIYSLPFQNKNASFYQYESLTISILHDDFVSKDDNFNDKILIIAREISFMDI